MPAREPKPLNIRIPAPCVPRSERNKGVGEAVNNDGNNGGNGGNGGKPCPAPYRFKMVDGKVRLA